MALWLVRAGSGGERQDYALDRGFAVIGWDEMGDLGAFLDKPAMRTGYEQIAIGRSTAFISNHIGQLWAFSHRIAIGDLIALPLKHQDAIAFGTVTGGYEFHADGEPGTKHRLPVKWIVQDLPRARLDQDILFSLGAIMTVCQVKRNDAEARVRQVLAGRPAVNKDLATARQGTIEESSDDESLPTTDLATVSADRIRAFMAQKFTGHKLAEVVEAVLVAQGYRTSKSDPGPDGGVDIIAGRGPLGFDEPRLVVQVKGGDTQQDIRVVRELTGVMHDFGAQQGLFVAWGGFKRSVWQEARQRFFEIRLWQASDLIAAVEQHYEQLPEWLRAELPLKRIWTLVPEEHDV